MACFEVEEKGQTNKKQTQSEQRPRNDGPPPGEARWVGTSTCRSEEQGQGRVPLAPLLTANAAPIAPEFELPGLRKIVQR